MIVMIYEITGSRILAPYFGTSTFVWTSIIGVILGSLSLGYYFGGILADRKADMKILSYIVFLSGVSITMTIVLKDSLLPFLQSNFTDVRLSSVLASILLFLPASFFLGMVSPYTVKLKMKSLKDTGKTIGNLYALSTLGCITGTFLAGFYLIPFFGTNKLLTVLIISLVLLSIVISVKSIIKVKLLTLLFVSLSIFQSGGDFVLGSGTSFIDIDTQYNRIWIYDFVDHRTGRDAKVMGINNENHSSMFLDSDDLVNEYTKYYHLVRHFMPNFSTSLMIGGAGYSFPKNFLYTYDNASMDVVEIDPKVTELAKKYFRLQENPRLSIYHEDARVFLNRSGSKYDVIFGDAFGSRHSIPYHLTTYEAVVQMSKVLNDDGIVILNTISSIEGDSGSFLQAQYATFKKVFPQVLLFPTVNSEDPEIRQNIILVALKSSDEVIFESSDLEVQTFLDNYWKGEVPSDIQILTDDYAPVEYYVNRGNW